MLGERSAIRSILQEYANVYCNYSSQAKKSLSSKATRKQRAPAGRRKATQKKRKSNRIAALKK